jgi:hypothetical protein
MSTMQRMFVLLVMTGAMWLPAKMVAQAPTAEPVTGSTDKAAASDRPAFPIDQLVTTTVHEAWVASGRNEDKFFEMVQQLTELSAAKRGITLPETQEAGTKAGNWIRKEARKDPDQLLYVVVDRAVRYVGKKQASAASSTAPTMK